MSGIETGILGFGVMLLMLGLRMPIGAAMLLTGFGGYVALAGWDPLLNHLKTAAYARLSNYDLSVIPLFLLMGNLASSGGLSKALFNAANAFIGHWRGGIAMGAIAACAGFGAICGSSLATAATMGRVALPELKRFNYAPSLATGALAAGGTLGIMIPPSVPLVIYAMLTQQNIAKLFMAAFVPGIIAMIGYMIVIGIFVRVAPGSGPAGPLATWLQRGRALVKVWPVASIFILVIGGIYGGIFTPTEAASIGTILAGIAAFATRELNWNGFVRCLYSTAEASAMIFFILLGADILNSFLALSQMPA
ncbi:MAG: TRAP transporter large permease, partial [Acidobacteriota bacterium]